MKLQIISELNKIFMRVCAPQTNIFGHWSPISSPLRFLAQLRQCMKFSNYFCNVKARLVLQSDHNLVIYDQYNNAIWNTQTNGRGSGIMRLVMQDDANLVLYDQNNQVRTYGICSLLNIHHN